MFVYIDALFGLRHCPEAESPSSVPTGEGVSITTDSPGVRDILPFILYPKAILMATPDGEVDYISSTDARAVLSELGKKMMDRENKSNVTYVGWYLDQTIIPCLCANAFLENQNLPNRLFRKLDDKWSKTGGISLERAFWQGWYSDSKSENPWNSVRMTLSLGCKLCGLSTAEDIAASATDITDKNKLLLMSRVSAISALHSRYVSTSIGE